MLQLRQDVRKHAGKSGLDVAAAASAPDTCEHWSVLNAVLHYGKIWSVTLKTAKGSLDWVLLLRLHQKYTKAVRVSHVIF